MKLRQYTLRSPADPSNRDSGWREMTVWLEDDRATIGDTVSLKDTDEPDRLWEIKEAYSTQDHDSINRTNNFGGSIKGRGSLED